MTGSKFCFCPNCGSDLRGGILWADASESTSRALPMCPDGCGAPEHYSITLAIYDPDMEQVVAWQCPDCGKRWER